jgi:alkyl sulfatase BDS1-like metallo-beta-lactamase superfamily hydrolase
MGGAEEGLRKGIKAFESGDYRWAATVFNHLVFADAGNRPAQEWLAAAYEQMGFQAESGAWRNYYLTAAMELRDGLPEIPLTFDDPEFLQGVPTPALLDALVARYNPAKLRREAFVIQFLFPDREEQFHIDINPAVAFPRSGMAPAATAQLTLGRGDFDRLLLRQVELPALLQSGQAQLVGDGTAIGAFFAALDQFEYWFNVVTP